MEPLFLTVREVAELLRTSEKAIFCAISRGRLAGVTRVGRRVLVRRDLLLRALDEKTTSHAGK
jgi:excisionase family DNA binding protein